MPHDCKGSPGYDAAKLAPERLDKFKALAQKAQSTFPPKLPPGPFEGPVSTPAGDRMLERGRWANANRKPAPRDSGSTGSLGPGFPTMKELDEELGGPDGYFTLCGLHYVNLFTNPRMMVLFNTNDPDSAVDAMQHGKRIAATLLDEVFSTRYFASLGRGFSGAFAVMGTHSKAKQCPFRPTSQHVAMPKGHRKANRRFTIDQRDSWVGSHMCAAEELGASAAFQEKYGLWLAMSVSAYAPFVDEKTGQLDWMEESSYG